MNSVPRADDLPVLPLLGSRFQKARKPDEGNGYRAAISEVHTYGVLCEVDVLDSLPGSKV